MKINIAHTVGGYSERHPPYGHKPVPRETGSRVWGFVRYGVMRKGERDPQGRPRRFTSAGGNFGDANGTLNVCEDLATGFLSHLRIVKHIVRTVFPRRTRTRSTVMSKQGEIYTSQP